MVKSFINSLMTNTANWKAAVSLLLTVFMGTFATYIMDLGNGFVTWTIGILIFLCELVITLQIFAHGSFEASNNQKAVRRSWIFIALGFIFNSVIIMAGFWAGTIAENSVFMYFVAYFGANVFRIAGGMSASDLLFGNTEYIKEGVNFTNSQKALSENSMELRKIQMKHQIEIARLEKEKQEALAAIQNTPLALPMPAKIAKVVGQTVGAIASSNEIVRASYAEGKQKTVENARKTSENIGKQSENKAENIFEEVERVERILITGEGKIKILYNDDTETSYANKKSLQGAIGMYRRGERINLKTEALANFVYDLIQEIEIEPKDTSDGSFQMKMITVTQDKIQTFKATYKKETYA